MNIHRLILILLCLTISSFLALLGYLYASSSSSPNLFTTTQPQKRSIAHTIKATGFLHVEDSMRIGSLVEGIIKTLCVTENEQVHKGQILAIIDDGKDDTRVRSTKALWDKAIASQTYQKSFYARQTILFQHKHISLDDFERFTRDYTIANVEAEQYKAEYEQALLEFNNKTIRAPEDGIVISKISREGEAVALSAPATILYVITKDITKIRAKLDISEDSISSLHTDMIASISADAYPYKKFTGSITSINNSAKIQNGITYYEVTLDLDNTQHLLKDGMKIHAEIEVASKKNVVSIPHKALHLSRSALERIADIMHINIHSLNPEERTRTEATHTIWLLQNNTLIERPVRIGIGDASCCEVLSDLTEQEQVISSIVE